MDPAYAEKKNVHPAMYMFVSFILLCPEGCRRLDRGYHNLWRCGRRDRSRSEKKDEEYNQQDADYTIVERTIITIKSTTDGTVNDMIGNDDTVKIPGRCIDLGRPAYRRIFLKIHIAGWCKRSDWRK
jgi:hypothetical protein